MPFLSRNSGYAAEKERDRRAQLIKTNVRVGLELTGVYGGLTQSGTASSLIVAGSFTSGAGS